jgi:hypothetical protein
MKRLRDQDPVAARLEGAQACPPLLDAIFAFDGGRLTPYGKYLSWELLNHPLGASPWDAEDLIAMLLGLLDGEGPACREAFATVERWFRARGHAAVFDAWGEALAWMSSPDPQVA